MHQFLWPHFFSFFLIDIVMELCLKFKEMPHNIFVCSKYQMSILYSEVLV